MSTDNQDDFRLVKSIVEEVQQGLVLRGFNSRVIFDTFPGFKQWLENTNMFTAIKQDCKTPGVRIEATDGSIALNMRAGVMVNIAEDLPLPLIINFFYNWPERQAWEVRFKGVLEFMR